MKRAYLHFDHTLSKFVNLEKEGEAVLYEFSNRPSIKHVYESLGLPHTEVREVRVNGEVVDNGWILQDGDQVVVLPYPPLAPQPEPDPRFILDNHLGKLAVFLRMLSFDAEYRNDIQDEELASRSSSEGRILLTRDRGLLMRSTVTRGYCLRSLDQKVQVREVMDRYNLYPLTRPFTRCLRCNAPLNQVEKKEVEDQLEPLTRRYYEEFHQCSQCGKVYWKGSHYERMQGFIENILSSQLTGREQ
jgi:uncharacterized protein